MTAGEASGDVDDAPSEIDDAPVEVGASVVGAGSVVDSRVEVVEAEDTSTVVSAEAVEEAASDVASDVVSACVVDADVSTGSSPNPGRTDGLADRVGNDVVVESVVESAVEEASSVALLVSVVENVSEPKRPSTMLMIPPYRPLDELDKFDADAESDSEEELLASSVAEGAAVGARVDVAVALLFAELEDDCPDEPDATSSIVCDARVIVLAFDVVSSVVVDLLAGDDELISSRVVVVREVDDSRSDELVVVVRVLVVLEVDSTSVKFDNKSSTRDCTGAAVCVARSVVLVGVIVSVTLTTSPLRKVISDAATEKSGWVNGQQATRKCDMVCSKDVTPHDACIETN